MNTFRLKLFAMIAMLIDHIGVVYISTLNNYWLYVAFRGVGRLAFPIFVFLIIEGFYHTRDVKKYLIRLGVFALISEIPYDLAFYKYHSGSNFITDFNNMFEKSSNFKLVIDNLSANQNVFFTLFLGLLLIMLIDMVDQRITKIDLKSLIMKNSIDCFLVVGFCMSAKILNIDYEMVGILMIASFYLFRGSKVLLAISTFIIMATQASNFMYFRDTGNIYAIISVFATLAIIPIAFYNGEKGKSVKYLFYAFYPAHLVCLFIIGLFF